MAQDAQARFISGNAINMVDVPADASTTKTQGDVITIGDIVVVALRDSTSGTQASYARKGVYDVVKANGSVTAGAKVYWDDDGNPQGGTASTGCATTSSGGNKLMGYATQAAAETAEVVRVVLASD